MASSILTRFGYLNLPDNYVGCSAKIEFGMLGFSPSPHHFGRWGTSRAERARFANCVLCAASVHSYFGMASLTKATQKPKRKLA